jgi:hypothetical protein
MRFHSRFALVAAVILAGQARAGGPVLIDDFNDGDDNGWTHVDYTIGYPYGPGIYSAATGVYRFRTTGVVPANSFNIVSAAWNASSDPFYSHGRVRARIRSNAPVSNPAIVLRWNTASHTGYALGADAGNGRVFIQRVDCSPITCSPDLLVYADVQPAYAVGVDWILEASAVGDWLSIRAWRVGDPEPAEPQIIVQDSNYPTGLIGLGIAHGTGIAATLDGHVDDITFTPLSVADITGDGTVNVDDLLAVIGAWGSCPKSPAECPGDIAPQPRGDGTVDIDDLLLVISNWDA